MDEGRALKGIGVGGAVLAVASVIAFGVAIGFDPLAGAEFVGRLLEVDPSEAGWVKLAAVLDMFGYYFLPAVIVLAMRDRVPWRSALQRDVATIGGLAYAIVGAAGAAILAVAGSELIEVGNHEDLGTLARIVEGMWQWFEPVPFGAWSLFAGLALRRLDPFVSALFLVAAVGAGCVLVGHLIGQKLLLAAGLTLWLGLLPIILVAVTRTLSSSRADPI